MLTFLLAGFTVNLFTSIDDALTRIPVLSASARSTKGRLAFSLGNLLAVTLAVIIAFVLSRFLVVLPGGNTLIAGLVFLMAIALHFDLFSLRPPKKVDEEIEHTKASPQKLRKLVWLGFVMTFITMIDDMFALTPLFTEGLWNSLAALVGIYAAAILLIIGVIYFSDKIRAVPHKRSIATATLLVFSALLFFGVV